MAIAGSTRMQATTSEQLIAGAALENAILRIAGEKTPDHLSSFKSVLDTLTEKENIRTAAAYIDYETGVYRKKGKMTYFAEDFMLDIFTDTTERSPTFMLPPFRRRDDSVSPQSWAFVKNPLRSTPETWKSVMHRNLRCLNWTDPDYEQMGSLAAVSMKRPRISENDLLAFEIGNENIPVRAESENDSAVLFLFGDSPSADALRNAFDSAAVCFGNRKILSVASKTGDFRIHVSFTPSPLRLMEHMLVKLLFNTVSTGTMVRMGRVAGNWMSWVDLSNKKLLDRGTRLVAELAGISYEQACVALFEAVEEIERTADPKSERVSAVQYALKKLKTE
jgi:N-acetylmuramic acid 6-phosphate etherase